MEALKERLNKLISREAEINKGIEGMLGKDISGDIILKRLEYVKEKVRIRRNKLDIEYVMQMMIDKDEVEIIAAISIFETYKIQVLSEINKAKNRLAELYKQTNFLDEEIQEVENLENILTTNESLYSNYLFILTRLRLCLPQESAQFTN